MAMVNPGPSSPLGEVVLPKAWAAALETNSLTVALSGIIYGVQLATYAMSIQVLVRRGLKDSTARRVLVSVSTVMVLCCGIILGSIIATSRTQITSLTTHSVDQTSAYVRAIVVTTCVGVVFTLNDALIIWRAWILVNLRLRIVLVLCFCGTLASIAVLWGKTFSQGPLQTPLLSLILGMGVLITNFLATSMIAWKLWSYRKSVKIYMEDSDSSSVEKILILLTETGFVHLFLWIFTVLAMHQSLDSSNLLVSGIMKYINVFLVGLHPLLVILFIAQQQSGLDAIQHEESMSRSLNFAANPARSRSVTSGTQLSQTISTV